MKTPREIATIILNRRNSGSPFIMTEELSKALGGDSYAEALRRKWIMPNVESGMIQITGLGSKLEEMQAIIDSSAQVGDAATVVEDGQVYQGRVDKINSDGTLSLSFENEHPSSDKQYSPEEIKLTADDSTPHDITPEVPGPAMVRHPSVGLSAPGIGR